MNDTQVGLSSAFEESMYLLHNPDVKAAVEAGVFPSGKHHFLSSGHVEGRPLRGDAPRSRVGAPRIPALRSQFDFYHANGFLVIDTKLRDQVLDGAIAELAPHYKDEDVPMSGAKDYLVPFADHRRIQDGWHQSAQVRAIATCPAVLDTLRMLYGGRRAFPFQTLNFRFGSEQPVHSDTVHFNSMPSGFMVGVWVALQDIDHRSGPVVYYPGTHLLPEVLTQDIHAADTDLDYDQYEAFVHRSIVTSPLFKPSHGLLRKGQVLIWAANLHHGGSSRLVREMTRHSQVTHYFFEDCQYWTPRLSRVGHPHLRTPTAIPR